MTVSSRAGSSSAVLGAGNGGLALAGDLALQGHDVRLYEHPDFSFSISELQRTPRLTLVDAQGREQTAILRKVGDDLDEALEGANLIHLVVPVSAQEVYFRMLLPRLGPDCTIVLWAGRLGSLRFKKLARQAGMAAEDAKIAEVNTLPYGCRRIGERQVRIAFRALKMFATGIPHESTRESLQPLQSTFPNITIVKSAIEVALRNSSMLVLGIGPLLNVGAIEAMQGNFALFRDGMTSGVRRTVRAAHYEFIEVGRAWGVDIAPYPEEVYEHPTSVEGANFRDTSGGYDGFALLTGPDRLFHRYTVENVRYGFAIIAELGRVKGVVTPTLDALTHLADTICGREFSSIGWKLEDLDLV
ncbi:NAD/NADP-dependent octopine/nopaline dehydrogenase family protein [Microvirga massiliensis]|uniref:NAD/NADP-dependent octopine/nopaline dehydrogenase family protein n=1 Tax=Microvirga massiliensis TaxID=1033741 RepID=UPI00062B475F|nr:NAD/NADP-dependent octopine/nopaline dehydrogenase family protein [Microvirga massiliensis]